MERDAVDDVIDQWARERPDLDLAPMATFGRMARVAARLGPAVDAVFAPWGIQTAEFDVLATLRRAGRPYELTPGALARTLLLSPAGMTSRLDRLEARGLVRRRTDPTDRRSSIVDLTDAGLGVVDEAVTAHVANEASLLSPLSDADRRALDRALRRLLGALEARATG